LDVPYLSGQEVRFMSYGVSEFVKDLRAAVSEELGETAVVQRIKPLAERLARSPAWVRSEYYECNPEQGFGVHVLHEEPEHGLWLIAASWLPQRGAPPHNHGTWAVIAGVDGEEKNILWLRRGERLERHGERVVGAGQAMAFPSDAIHSVINEGVRTTLSLHVYGRNLNFAQRSQFDQESGAETPFILKLG
jgi:predicted metal-dependent enzyme (double-stranded beta helix superfamily)